jgi:hypothetical protein
MEILTFRLKNDIIKLARWEKSNKKEEKILKKRLDKSQKIRYN